jgi:hypothetical protein
MSSMSNKYQAELYKSSNKSHKYILRYKGRNGNWCYIYDIDPKNIDATKRQLNKGSNEFVQRNKQLGYAYGYSKNHDDEYRRFYNDEEWDERQNKISDLARIHTTGARDEIADTIYAKKALQEAYDNSIYGKMDKGKKAIQKVFNAIKSKLKRKK